MPDVSTDENMQYFPSWYSKNKTYKIHINSTTFCVEKQDIIKNRFIVYSNPKHHHWVFHTLTTRPPIYLYISVFKTRLFLTKYFSHSEILVFKWHSHAPMNVLQKQKVIANQLSWQCRWKFQLFTMICLPNLSINLFLVCPTCILFFAFCASDTVDEVVAFATYIHFACIIPAWGCTFDSAFSVQFWAIWTPFGSAGRVFLGVLSRSGTLALTR